MREEGAADVCSKLTHSAKVRLSANRALLFSAATPADFGSPDVPFTANLLPSAPAWPEDRLTPVMSHPPRCPLQINANAPA